MISVRENNKRLAKNTFFLYIRLILTMSISLYTSRIVLSTLGIDDFGLNLVVTSVITMFDFLNHSMAVSTSRFLTLEIGKKNFNNLKQTFSASLTVHIIIVIVVLVLCETLGLWYLENKMVIEPDRLIAARWVYQLSLLGALITIIQTPYNALIISHEKMNVYSFFSILNSIFKLIIIFLLEYGSTDRLIYYAILTLIVTILITSINILYCLKEFKECKYKLEWNKTIITPILKLSGWNLFANIGADTKERGVNLILNLFFTTVVNAAYGVSIQVFVAVNSFYSSFMMALKPQIVKYFAENRIREMIKLSIDSTKFSYVLCLIIAIPMIVEMDYILNLWLTDVPKYTILYCQLSLIVVILNSLWGSVNYIVYATGKIKSMSIIIGLINFLVPLLTYILYKTGVKIVILPLLINIVTTIMTVYIVVRHVKKLIPEFSIHYYIKEAIIKSTFVALISIILPVIVYLTFEQNFIRLLLVLLTTLFVLLISSYFVLFDNEFKIELKKKINQSQRYIKL